MITKPTKLTKGAALAAALSMIATPAAAVELPYVGPSNVEVQTGAAQSQDNQRRYRHRRYRNRIDAGDVIAGVLVLGAIAAIVGSGNNRNRDRDRNRERDTRDRDDRRDRNTNTESRGIENATSICVEQVERGSERVEDISSARRTTDGWRVEGTLTSGEGWNCWIDNDGRIRSVDFGASDYSSDASGDQLNDDAYARARSGTRTAADGEYTYRAEAQYTPDADAPQPAYPGGPLPGEEGYSDVADATSQAEDAPQSSS